MTNVHTKIKKNQTDVHRTRNRIKNMRAQNLTDHDHIATLKAAASGVRIRKALKRSRKDRRESFYPLFEKEKS